MGRTIIQPIGPLYGEPINNTVYGRPNGSIYVPDSNTITISNKTGCDYLKVQSNNFFVSLSNGTVPSNPVSIVAISQDNAAYVSIGIYTDEECTTILASGTIEAKKDFTAGNFNLAFGFLFTKAISVTPGETYYLRATLNASTGVPVAVSAVLPLEAL